jgi:hypothetical protein
MRQSYSGPGSPYWASLGLAGLALPESHPVWAATEEPAPTDRADFTRPIRPIGWLASGTVADGIVRVINHGVDHSAAVPKIENPDYNRYGYSTATAPVPLPDGSSGRPVDNQVALVDSEGRWSQRPIIDLISIDDHRAESRQLVRFARPDPSPTRPEPESPTRPEPVEGFDDGPELRCVSIVRGAVEVRAVRLSFPEPVEGQALVISGYAVPRQPFPGARTDLINSVVSLTDAGTIGSSVHPIDNPFGADLEVHWIRFDDPQPDRWYVAAIGLGEREPEWPTAEVDHETDLMITWPDGESDRLA